MSRRDENGYSLLIMPGDRLVAIWTYDAGPGPPYYPWWQEMHLWLAEEPDEYSGRRFFTCAGGSPGSIQWVSNERAREFLEKATRIREGFSI